MWRSRGRGRARGRRPDVAQDTATDSRPGVSKAPPGDDAEDWEKGIETQYSVKSITYVGGQPITAGYLSQAPQVYSNLAQSAQQPTLPSAQPTDPADYYVAPTTTSIKNPGKYIGRPPEEFDSESDGEGYRSKICTVPQSEKNSLILNPMQHNPNMGSQTVPTKKPTEFVGMPVDEFESDCEDTEWDFGDEVSATPTNADGAVGGKGSMDIGVLTQRNPGVCITWLQSLLSHKETKNKNVAVGNKNSNRCVSSGPKGCEPKLWPEMKLFSGADRSECDRWLGDVQRSWGKNSMKVTAELLTLVNQCFCSVDNPYATALYLIESVADCRNVKSSTLSHHLAREFEKWTRRNPQSVHILKQGGEALQIYAFYVGTRFHMTAFDFIVKAFQLSHPPNQFLTLYIQPFIQLGKLKEACHCISRLNLHKHFNTEDIVFPLILQDKVNLVEQYVYQRKKQQMELLQLLDRLCDDNVNLNKLAEDSGVKDIRYNKLERKALGKLAVRLMKLYQIPQDVCPNVDRRRNLAAMRYTFYKFYIEESVSRETWRELVAPSVSDNIWLQERLIDELLTYSDVTEAVWWVHQCQMENSTLPSTVLKALEEEDAPPSVLEPNNENWENDLLMNNTIYLTLKIPLSEVRFIDTRSDFIDTIHYVVKNTNILGLDAEWRPSLGRGTRVALLQIATPTHVYLLDIISLCPILTDADWTWFGEQVFLNAQIVKIGYGFEGDVQMLSASIPALKEPIIKAQRMVELEKLHRQVRKNPDLFKSKISLEDTQSQNAAVRTLKSDERGLSGMARHCLGRPLDKAEQMSDWEKRPLRLAQLVYAALDALVLIELYEHVVERAGTMDIPVQLEPRVTSKCEAHRSRMEKRQARVAERSEEQKLASQHVPVPLRGPPISPSELTVVVDTMVQGLGRYLRSCGVDTKILDSSEDHNAAIDIAIRENRVILTCGQAYTLLCTQVPHGMCYNVMTNEKACKQAMDVLDHFNVRVTEADIFSRCQVCNGARYLHIAPEEMRRAWDRRMLLLTKHHGRVFPPHRIPTMHPPTMNKKPTCPTLAPVHDVDFTWDHINMDNVTVNGGVFLQVEAIPRDVTHQVQVFYACASCGKVFWEGKHFSRVCEQFSEVLNRSRRSAEEGLPRDMAAEINEMLTLKA